MAKNVQESVIFAWHCMCPDTGRANQHNNTAIQTQTYGKGIDISNYNL